MNKKLINIAILGSLTFSSVILPVTALADSIDSKIEQQDTKINTLKKYNKFNTRRTSIN